MGLLGILWMCAAVAWASAPQYRIDAFAGTDYSGDGRSALAAALIQPQSVAVDRHGNVYFSDTADHRVRRVVGGILQTVAGTGFAGYKGDGGPAQEAQLNAPYGIAFDLSGNLYIADLGNACIRRVGTDGTILTVAGRGEQTAVLQTPLLGSKAKLMQPRDIAVDRLGAILFTDFGANRVYELTPAGWLNVLAEAPFSSPAGIAVDEMRNIYVADSGNRRVRRILSNGIIITVADRLGKPLEFGTPTGVALDAAGRLYVADGGSRMTMVNQAGDLFAWGIGGTSVAIGPLAEIYSTEGKHVKRWVAGVLDIVAGAPTGTLTAGDGRPKSEWRFNSPAAMVRDTAGNLFVADTANGRIRRISADGALSTLTAQIAAPVALALDSQGRLHAADRATGNIYRVQPSGKVDLYASAPENRPLKPGAIAFDISDRLHVADSGNHLIRRVQADGTHAVIAGGGNDINDGPALLAKLSSPAGIAFDARGDLWFTEAGSGRLRKIAGGNIVTHAGTDFREPRGIRATSDGGFFVADAGAHRVLFVARDGSWTPVAGSGDKGLSGDGSHALAAALNAPVDTVVEPDGSVLVLDSGNNRIRRLTPMETAVVVPPPALVVSPLGVLHLGTKKDQPVAPGQLILLSSEDTSWADSTVTVAGQPARVLAWAGTTATVLLPSNLPAGPAELAVSTGATAAVEIVSTAPGLLTTREGSGQAAAVNEDARRNAFDAPAARGSVLSLYLTGQGTGEPVIRAEIGGYSCDVVWAGAAPGLPGLWQVNVRTPSGFAPAGIQPVTLYVNGIASQPGVTVATR